MNSKTISDFKDMSSLKDEPLLSLKDEDLMELPSLDGEMPLSPPADKWTGYDFSLDGFTPLGIPRPKTEEEKERLVNGFLRGLQRLFSPNDNWTFLQILKLAMDYCVKCQTCSEQCHVYLASGRQEIYRPTYRSEVLRRLYKRYFTTSGRLS